MSNETGIAANTTDSRGFNLDRLVGQVPTPEFLVALEEQQQRLLGILRDDQLRQIAIARIEGYTVAEIAAVQAVSTRSVERKLQLIRNSWSKDLADDEIAVDS